MNANTVRRLGRTRWVAALAVGALGLTACGGGSSHNASGIPSLGGAGKGATSTTVNVEQAVGAFVKCLRAQGLSVADPKIDSNGRVDMRSIFQSANIDPRSTDFRGVMQKCGSYLRDAGFGPSPQERQQRQEAMLKYTSCLRSNGLHVGDITFGGPGGGGGGFGGPGGPDDRGNNSASGATTTTAANGATPPSIAMNGAPPDGGGDRGPATPEERNQRMAQRLGVDYNDPKVKAAFSACQSILQALRPPGGRGGFFGGGSTTTAPKG